MINVVELVRLKAPIQSGTDTGIPRLLAAAPTRSLAADVVEPLQDQGYSVQLNGPTNGPISMCTVTGVHGLTATMPSDGNLMMKMEPAESGTVDVDLSCPPTNS